MKFFDLHLHPVLKTLFKDPANHHSPWEVIQVNDGLFGHILSSQSSLGSIAQMGQMNLICMPTYGPEMYMMKQLLLYIGSGIYAKYVDLDRIRSFFNGRCDYITSRSQEWQFLNEGVPPSLPDLANKKIKVLHDMSEYDATDMDTIHILFTAEGAHNFYNAGNDDTNTAGIINNFIQFVKGGPLVLYVTLSHLAPSVFVNHAYGIKLFSKKNLIPRGNGILVKGPLSPGPDGYDLLNAAHQNYVPVDMKHMSLHARKQFYVHHDTYFPDRPIMASHVGFTGFSWNDMNTYVTDISPMQQGTDINAVNYYTVSYNKKKGQLDDTYFNPDSINMYDEDLLHVLKSNGLIGLSMDIRILGASGATINESDEVQSDTTEKEFISYENDELFEFSGGQNILNVGNTTINNTQGNDDVESYSEEELMDHQQEMEHMLIHNIGDYPELHVRHYINHILHVCKLAADNKLTINPLEHICIGSDFDGLIESIHCCTTVTDLPAFAELLRDRLPKCAVEAGITLTLPVDTIISNLCFDNAFRFITTHCDKVKNGGYR